MTKKLGIMGGTFNPIHVGHLIVAQEVMNTYDLGKVVFIPNQMPPHRLGEKGIIDGEDRYIMVNLAIASNPRFFASRIEIDRKKVSYTLDTIKDLQKAYPKTDLTFITGIDALLKYEWYCFDQILALLTNFVSVTRPGYSENLLEFRKETEKLEYIDRIKIMKIPGVDISSTQIRERLKEGKPIKYLVTPEVENYIYKKHLYM